VTSFKDPDGILLCRATLPSPLFATLTRQIDARYQALEAAHCQGGPIAVSRLLAPDQRFVPTASSLTIGAVLSDENLRALFAALNLAPAGAWARNQLQDRVACDLDQAWVRRQYAPRHYPPWHAPHGWHQDGALGFDFLSAREGKFPSDALLPMITCWIALGSCGADAPGLELVTRRLEGLLAPAQLTDEQVRARFAPEEFWQPVLGPCDAMLFPGDILHRTHVTSSMTKDRTSLELRFFPAANLPERLKNDRFIHLD
jgi:hypothetical protein